MAAQVERLTERFSLSRVVLAGDRGMLTDARIREDVEPAGLRWITALRAPAIRKLASGGDLQLSIFDTQDLAEISAPKLYPDERLVVCRNPLLAAERARKREALLAATEAKLELVVRATTRENRPLRGTKDIAVRADRALRAHKVGKHFTTTVTEDGFSYERDEARIAEETALDGIYVIRTNVPAKRDRRPRRRSGPTRASAGSSAPSAASRGSTSRSGPSTTAWRSASAPTSSSACSPTTSSGTCAAPWRRCSSTTTTRPRPKPPAPRPSRPPSVSQAARAKAGRKRTPDGLPVHSFQTLLDDLATLTRNRVTARRARGHDRRHARPPHTAPGQSLPTSSASGHDPYPVAYTPQSDPMSQRLQPLDLIS